MEKGCQGCEGLRAKAGGWRSLAHTRWSGEGVTKDGEVKEVIDTNQA